MKSVTFLTAPLLLLVLSIFAVGQPKTDRETAGLLGPVKSVGTTELDTLGKFKQSGDRVTYDQAGHETSREMASDYGEAMGKLTGNIGDKGLLTESTWTDPKGKIISRNVYSYSDGRLIENLTYNGGGVLVEKTVISYDSAGRRDAETYWSPVKPVAKTTFQYGKDSQPIHVAFFLADGRKATAPVGPCLGAHRVEYTYDDKGRVLTRKVFEDDGTLKKSYQYTYDNKGNTAEYVSRSQYSSVTFVYKYEFDAKGNWIKQSATGTSVSEGPGSFGKGAPYVRTNVTTREITYY